MQPLKKCAVHTVNPAVQCTSDAVCFVLVHERVLFADTHALYLCDTHRASEFRRSLDERKYYWASDVVPIPPWIIPS